MTASVLVYWKLTRLSASTPASLAAVGQFLVGGNATVSTFTCKCGETTRDSEEEPDASGILLGNSETHDLEERIADSVTDFLATPTAERPEWLRAHFGSLYPTDLQPRDVVSDIVSSQINGSAFSTTFTCPACGRLAIAAPESKPWVFYSPE